MQEELLARERLIVTLQAELASIEERVTTIEHELHDGPLQRVIAAKMELQALMGTPDLKAQILEKLEELDCSLEIAVGQVRSILAGPFALDLHQSTDLATLCMEFSEPRFQVALNGESSLDDVDEDVADSIMRIVRELIWNARKHSGATEVSVLIQRDTKTLMVEVSDLGKGFIPDQVPEDSFGLCTAIQRARTFDIDLHIDSAPGEGTRVVLRKSLK